MSIYSRICIGLFGIAAGFVVLMAMDMTINSGRFVAHAIHQNHPGCSDTCHGQNATRPSAVLALPPVRDTDRSDTTPTQPRRYPLLGVRMEVQGGD